MYRSHSPNSVAVVPSPPSSFSPLGSYLLESEFACDLPAKKPCFGQVPSTQAYPFGDYTIQDIAAFPSADATGPSQTPSPALPSPPAYNAVVQTPAAFYQPLGKFEDPDIASGLPAFLQDSLSSVAMQSLQQGGMQQPGLAAGQTSFDLPSTRTPGRKEDDYKLAIHQQPEEVSLHTTKGRAKYSNELTSTRAAWPAMQSAVVKTVSEKVYY